jgi:hypothetical protein
MPEFHGVSYLFLVDVGRVATDAGLLASDLIKAVCTV